MAEVAAVQHIPRSLLAIIERMEREETKTSLLGRKGFLIGCLAPTALDTEMSGAQKRRL